MRGAGNHVEVERLICCLPFLLQELCVFSSLPGYLHVIEAQTGHGDAYQVAAHGAHSAAWDVLFEVEHRSVWVSYLSLRSCTSATQRSTRQVQMCNQKYRACVELVERLGMVCDELVANGQLAASRYTARQRGACLGRAE